MKNHPPIPFLSVKSENKNDQVQKLQIQLKALNDKYEKLEEEVARLSKPKNDEEVKKPSSQVDATHWDNPDEAIQFKAKILQLILEIQDKQTVKLDNLAPHRRFPDKSSCSSDSIHSSQPHFNREDYMNYLCNQIILYIKKGTPVDQLDDTELPPIQLPTRSRR